MFLAGRMHEAPGCSRVQSCARGSVPFAVAMYQPMSISTGASSASPGRRPFAHTICSAYFDCGFAPDSRPSYRKLGVGTPSIDRFVCLIVTCTNCPWNTIRGCLIVDKSPGFSVTNKNRYLVNSICVRSRLHSPRYRSVSLLVLLGPSWYVAFVRFPFV